MKDLILEIMEDCFDPFDQDENQVKEAATKIDTITKERYFKFVKWTVLNPLYHGYIKRDEVSDIYQYWHDKIFKDKDNETRNS